MADTTRAFDGSPGRRAGAVGLRARRRRAARRLGRRRRSASTDPRATRTGASMTQGIGDRQRRRQPVGRARQPRQALGGARPPQRARARRCSIGCSSRPTCSSPASVPARCERLGLDADEVRERYPRLVYAAGTATACAAPMPDQPGYDASAFWARGGVGARAHPARAATTRSASAARWATATARWRSRSASRPRC